MKTISKGKLKAQMLEIFREIERTGQPIVVTDHGRPVLQVSPVKAPALTVDEAFGPYRGKLRYDEATLLAPTTPEWSEV